MKTTIGVFSTHTAAEKALHDLRQAHIGEDSLSYLYQNSSGDVKDSQNGHKVSTGTAVGATAGAVIGGIAGLVAANAVIPGLGTFVVAGYLAETLGVVGATAIAGIGAGVIAGGIIGALSQIGVSTDDVHLYEEHVKKGGVLVIARTETGGNVKSILEKNGGTDVREYALS
jgi:hypothetical protein